MSTASERAKTAAQVDAEARLANGRWVRRSGVQVWVANPVLEPKRPTFVPHELIACPTCLARMDEKCRQPDGANRRRTCAARLVKRVCSCGGRVRHKEEVCGFCRAEASINDTEDAA